MGGARPRGAAQQFLGTLVDKKGLLSRLLQYSVVRRARG